MKKIIFIAIAFIAFSCSINKNTVTYSCISQKEFLNKPFGFNETIANFKSITNPRFKVEKTLRNNKHYPEKTDTIYKFTCKKSALYFYKTHLNQEFLLVGKIVNKEIELKNGVKVGLTKHEFKSRFKDQLPWQKDSLRLIGEGIVYTFIFDENKLSRINIDNYVD